MTRLPEQRDRHSSVNVIADLDQNLPVVCIDSEKARRMAKNNQVPISAELASRVDHLPAVRGPHREPLIGGDIKTIVEGRIPWTECRDDSPVTDGPGELAAVSKDFPKSSVTFFDRMRALLGGLRGSPGSTPATDEDHPEDSRTTKLCACCDPKKGHDQPLGSTTREAGE